jgi:hypothetical protein
MDKRRSRLPEIHDPQRKRSDGGLIWAYVVLSEDLLGDRIDSGSARRSLLIFAAGNPLYLLAIGVWSLRPELALAIYALSAFFN